MRIRTKIIAWMGIVLACQLAQGGQNPMQAWEIVDRSFEVTKLAGAEMLSTMTIIDRIGESI